MTRTLVATAMLLASTPAVASDWVLDHRTYVFAPGRGLVGHARR